MRQILRSTYCCNGNCYILRIPPAYAQKFNTQPRSFGTRKHVEFVMSSLSFTIYMENPKTYAIYDMQTTIASLYEEIKELLEKIDDKTSVKKDLFCWNRQKSRILIVDRNNKLLPPTPLTLSKTLRNRNEKCSLFI